MKILIQRRKIYYGKIDCPTQWKILSKCQKIQHKGLILCRRGVSSSWPCCQLNLLIHQRMVSEQKFCKCFQSWNFCLFGKYLAFGCFPCFLFFRQCSLPRLPARLYWSIKDIAAQSNKYYLINWWSNNKTLPEAQRTQGIDSITWVNISARKVQNWFQSHFLNWLQIWPPGGSTCISYKLDHKGAPLASSDSWFTKWHHMH